METITREELRKVVIKLVLKKALGVDGIRAAEILKYRGELLVNLLYVLTRVCQVAWKVGRVSFGWSLAKCCTNMYRERS